MQITEKFEIISSSLFEKKPKNYPTYVYKNDIDLIYHQNIHALIERTKQLHLPFATIAIVQVGQENPKFEFLEGAFFLKYIKNCIEINSMDFPSEKKNKGKKNSISDFNIFYCDVNKKNIVFHPFLTNCIKKLIINIRDPKISLIYDILVLSVNPHLTDEEADSSLRRQALKIFINYLKQDPDENNFMSKVIQGFEDQLKPSFNLSASKDK